MARVILLIVFSCLLYSCENNDVIRNTDLTPGVYKGHFIRSNPYAKFAPSKVTLIFTPNAYTGESDVTNYPAICNGTYKITGQEIEFFNSCIWTGEFDQSLILKGKFELRVDGSQLEMTRRSNGQTYYYKLELQ